MACTGFACEATASLDLSAVIGGDSSSSSSGGSRLLLSSSLVGVALSVTHLRGDLGSPDIEFVRIFVDGTDTGVRCSSLGNDCGAPLGMNNPNAGDDCVESMDISPWLDKQVSTIDITLKASPLVNFCDPYVAATVALHISYEADGSNLLPSVAPLPLPTATPASGDDELFIIEGKGAPALGHCCPFGKGDGSFGEYKGMVYANLPALGGIAKGDRLSFDNSQTNDEDITMNIALASTLVDGGDEPSGPFVTVCTACTAASRGNSVIGDFEVTFTLNGDGDGGNPASPVLFYHNGGGLIIRLQAAGNFRGDHTCSFVGVDYDASDVTGWFKLRFMYSDDGEWPWEFAHSRAASFQLEKLIGARTPWPSPRPSRSPLPSASQHPTTEAAKLAAPTPVPTLRPSRLPSPRPTESRAEDDGGNASSVPTPLRSAGGGGDDEEEENEGDQNDGPSQHISPAAALGFAVALITFLILAYACAHEVHTVQRRERRERDGRRRRRRRQADGESESDDNDDQDPGALASTIPRRRLLSTRYAYEQRRRPVAPGSTGAVVCSICICDVGEFEYAKELACRHLFHAACIDEWLRVSRLCPNCKRPAAAAPPAPRSHRIRARWTTLRHNGDGAGGESDNGADLAPMELEMTAVRRRDRRSSLDTGAPRAVVVVEDANHPTTIATDRAATRAFLRREDDNRRWLSSSGEVTSVDEVLAGIDHSDDGESAFGGEIVMAVSSARTAGSMEERGDTGGSAAIEESVEDWRREEEQWEEWPGEGEHQQVEDTPAMSQALAEFRAAAFEEEMLERRKQLAERAAQARRARVNHRAAAAAEAAELAEVEAAEEQRSNESSGSGESEESDTSSDYDEGSDEEWSGGSGGWRGQEEQQQLEDTPAMSEALAEFRTAAFEEEMAESRQRLAERAAQARRARVNNRSAAAAEAEDGSATTTTTEVPTSLLLRRLRREREAKKRSHQSNRGRRRYDPDSGGGADDDTWNLNT